MRHTITVLVENEFGVLSRVAGLFSGRGFNIDSLSVAPTNDESISRMTIVTRGDDQILEQITKQLNKLIDVIKVIDFTDGEVIEREMALIKVTAEDDARAEVLRIVDIFRSKIIDVTPRSFTIEATGTPAKIDAILELLRPLGLKELVRTGPAAIGRGAKGWKG
ncbi:acetolactate synthase small subunit [Geobacter sulfurreducens]|jgi:acetolactate synthase-1/3 small subunit|uniref:Acetolactate synthase small subunit n=2 Tax=Geobacter TaxID=28231 RepID=Q74BW8_GEOSL|nr:MULTISPECIES: acetolactate synthase small subunit [Geobacter]BET58321.1 acetolactate synthase small subunit [Geobacter sp. 60473]AAR35286.1 acetolactate synthase, small subunit [Geobacter sulfurreducens PCA]ADI84748.1 acetolactate synthase, small subunit [Geobacter sulfurreducens KN400]AJY68158.1 acetolactate synthase [Geobacter sulfurreducens]MBE2886699.1 acetolactate synthase small subunit [Geobacter anodireducens]